MNAQDLLNRATELAKRNGDYNATLLESIINAGIVPARVRIGEGNGRWVESDGDDVIAYRRDSDGCVAVVNRAAATPAMLESLLVQHAVDVARIRPAPVSMGRFA